MQLRLNPGTHSNLDLAPLHSSERDNLNLNAEYAAVVLSCCRAVVLSCLVETTHASAGGLEVQLDAKGQMHCFDEAMFLSRFAKLEWEAVLTCVGGTMGNIGADATFGLASNDEAGRNKAIAFAKVALAAVQRWNNRAENCGKVSVRSRCFFGAPPTLKQHSYTKNRVWHTPFTGMLSRVLV